jgi:hypothetical protein
MARNKELRQLRDAEVVRQYNELDKKHLKHSYIVSELAKKHFLTERTVAAIISGEYDKRDAK